MSYISLRIAGILGSKKKKSMPERDLGYQAQNLSFTHEDTDFKIQEPSSHSLLRKALSSNQLPSDSSLVWLLSDLGFILVH